MFENIVLLLDFIWTQLTTNLEPVTALVSTTGKPSPSGPQKILTVNHKPQSNPYEEFKGFVEVTLYNINKWGCTLGWISLDAVPYLIR